MQISSSSSDLTTSQSINSLFRRENTGIELEELDESEVAQLVKSTVEVILNKIDVHDARSGDEVLALIRNYSTELFQDAVEGLAIIAKQNQLSSLLELDLWMNKERERCLGFLHSPKPSVQN